MNMAMTLICGIQHMSISIQQTINLEPHWDWAIAISQIQDLIGVLIFLMEDTLQETKSILAGQLQSFRIRTGPLI